MSEISNTEENKKRQLLIFVLVISILICIILVYVEFNRLFPSTDDAYVGANLVKIQPKVNGNINKVFVKNNQFVKKGESILKIDPTDYQLLVNKSKLDHLIAKNELFNSQKQVNQAHANIQKAKANYDFYQEMDKRYAFLYSKHASSLQTHQQSKAKFIQAREDLIQAKTAYEQAKVQFEATQEKVNLTLLQLENSQNQLKDTEIKAPSDGYISDLNVHEGQLVGVGETLFGFINDSVWWVDANFEETQLERIRIGQSVNLYLDMYSKKFHGKVDSLSYASGSIFSLLPPQNATGNWVKVIQRFPVRILIHNNPKYPLRVGSSAVVRIDTFHGDS